MINRTILEQIENSVKSKPVTLIVGARQVGKSTLAYTFEEQGFNYVSLDSARERQMAQNDPDMFLQLHPWPLIIDEIQRAPQLFSSIEEVVNKEKKKNIKNYGMYILTGLQLYKLMEGITESLSGRVSIIHTLPLSRNEIVNNEEKLFNFNIVKIQKKA